MSGARLSGTLVNQFKPSVAKGVYDFFGAKKVLDFSAGWGDRLVGFLASNAESYIGIDPNTKLHEPYRKIVEDNNRDKETKFICSPAERVDYSNLDYDFVFTSPPYFNLEVYTNEDTQSAKKETKIDDWLNDFLFETVNRVYEGLVDGGRIAINICDHRLFKVCKTLIEHMDSLGATYEGVLGFEIASRPLNSKGNVSRGNQDQRGEPIFIWSKGEAPSPKYNQDNFFGV
jgi:16S rRNA G966 N2-methylase RsmD